jgi:hypothetical protein
MMKRMMKKVRERKSRPRRQRMMVSCRSFFELRFEAGQVDPQTLHAFAPFLAG